MTPNQRKKLQKKKRILKDYQSGEYSLSELGLKYKLTAPRIHQIVNEDDLHTTYKGHVIAKEQQA